MTADELATPGDARLRVTVDGPTSLVVQPAAAETAATPPPRPDERLVAHEATAQDRSAGRHRFEAVVHGWRFDVTTEPARQAMLRDRAARAAAGHHPLVGITLRAQIPGRVVRVWVAEGEVVDQGQRLLAVEAMKMENEIRAPHAGRVERLAVEVGRLVERGDELVRIA